MYVYMYTDMHEFMYTYVCAGMYEWDVVRSKHEFLSVSLYQS